MSTLYIRLPSRFAADNAAHGQELPCPFALARKEGNIEREGVASLHDLAGVAAEAQRVVLLLAASDVALLRVKVPPMSPARLKAALPNLVEDRLIEDPSGCVAVAGDVSAGLRTVAVVRRDWLESLAGIFMAHGARRIAALPAQLCLPRSSRQDGVSATIDESRNSIDMALRFNEHEGVGVALAEVQGQGGEHERHAASAYEAIRTLCALVPESPVTLYVPQAALRLYEDAAGRAGVPEGRIDVVADSWLRWIAGAQSAALDLMAGAGVAHSNRPDWRPWRWPVALAAAVLLINVIALNADWWRMKSEAAALRASMVQMYRSVYPEETVILDPIAQMRQKIAMAKRDSGQPAPDDFIAILAAFGEAWGGAAPAIEALEYRERSLIVRLKPGAATPFEQIRTALSGHDLSLDVVSAQPAVWKIRSMR